MLVYNNLLNDSPNDPLWLDKYNTKAKRRKMSNLMNKNFQSLAMNRYLA